MKSCSVTGCHKKHEAKGYCSAHYRKVKRTASKDGRPHDGAWSDADDAALAQLNGKLPARQIAEELGRSLNSVKHRRRRLGLQDSDGQGGFKYSPYAISGRPLVAKSCTGCGTLRDAAAYLLSGKSWRGKCAYCLTEWRTDYYSKLPDIAKAKAWEAAKGIAHTKQSESLLRAENRGKQYTSADLEILASPSLTYAEKAEATGRSVSGIKSVCAKNGFVSRFSPIKNRSFPRWGIDKPGA